MSDDLERALTAALEPSRRLTEYLGRTLPQVSYSGTHVLLVDDGGPFPDGVERGESRGRRWVRVPISVVARNFKRRTRAIYDGQPVEIVSVEGDQVGILHSLDPAWARRHGLEGSAYEGGWHGYVPREALSDIEVTERDVPLPTPPDTDLTRG